MKLLLIEGTFKMSTFQAGVQYNDFKGSVAADQSDETRLLSYLKDKKLILEGETLVAFRIVFNENHGREITQPGIVAYLSNAGPVSAGDIVRAIDVDMSTAKLFSFLKRFDLVLTSKDVDLSDVIVDGPHYD